MSIPKIIHQIWLGDKPIPKRLCESWQTMYSDYDYKLWTDDNIPTELINKDKYNQAQDFCQKVDLLRYEILYKYGGFYVDADTLSINKIPDAFLEECELFSSYEYGKDDFKEKNASDLDASISDLISNAYIAAEPNHPLLKLVIDTIKNMPDDFYNKQKPWISTGPYMFTEIIKQYSAHKTDAKLKIFEKDLFNPFRLDNPLEKLSDETLKQAYAIHFFSSTYENYEFLEDVVRRLG